MSSEFLLCQLSFCSSLVGFWSRRCHLEFLKLVRWILWCQISMASNTFSSITQMAFVLTHRSSRIIPSHSYLTERLQKWFKKKIKISSAYSFFLCFIKEFLPAFSKKKNTIFSYPSGGGFHQAVTDVDYFVKATEVGFWVEGVDQNSEESPVNLP